MQHIFQKSLSKHALYQAGFLRKEEKGSPFGSKVNGVARMSSCQVWYHLYPITMAEKFRTERIEVSPSCLSKLEYFYVSTSPRGL